MDEQNNAEAPFTAELGVDLNNQPLPDGSGGQDLSDLLVSPDSAPRQVSEDLSDLLTQPLPPTAAQKTGAFIEAGVKEATPMAAGLTAAIGAAKVTAPTLNPWIVGGSFVTAGVAGYYGAKKAMEPMGLRSPEQMRPELRPYAYGGESFITGASMLYAGPGQMAMSGLRLTEGTIGTFLNRAATMSATKPVTSTVAEIGALGSAATGAALAEYVAPGDLGLRMGAELTMGFLNPARIATSAWDSSVGLFNTVKGSIGSQATENRAWNWISDHLEIAGEDPKLFIEMINRNKIIDPKTATAAQITGSPAAAAIEAYLAKSSGNFRAESASKLQTSFDAVRIMIVALEGTATPDGLKAAAELRNIYYNNLINARVNRANNDAVAKIEQVRGKSKEISSSDLSRVVREALEDSLTQSRAVESEMWNNVNVSGSFGTQNLAKAVDEIFGTSAAELKAEKIPREVLQLLGRGNATGRPGIELDPSSLVIKLNDTQANKPITYTDLKDFRGWLLEKSRGAVVAGNSGEARRMGQLAEAILDDMDAVMATAGNRAYDDARAFTRNLNEVFTRSYAGKALSQGRYGDRIPPEVLLRNATAGADEAASLKLEELNRATSFLDQYNIGGVRTAENIRLANDAQETYVRQLATAGLDEKTGKVTAERLRKFADSNKELLARFPGVKAQIDAAMTSSEALDKWQRAADDLRGIVKTRPITKILGSDPVTVSRQAILSPKREKDITELANFARRGGTDRRGIMTVTPDQAMGDLRYSMLQGAVNLSMRPVANTGPVLDMGRFRAVMFDPPAPGGKSLADILVEQKIFPKDHIDRMRDLVNAAETLSRSTKPASAITIKETIVDRLTRTGTKVLGSFAGAKSRAATGGPGNIILATESANLSQDILLRIPAANTMAMVEKLMADPEMLKIVSSRAMSPAQQQIQAGRFHAWAIQSGLTSGMEALRPTYEQEPEAPELFTQPR
jgi:hypothetical protein